MYREPRRLGSKLATLTLSIPTFTGNLSLACAGFPRWRLALTIVVATHPTLASGIAFASSPTARMQDDSGFQHLHESMETITR